MNTSQRFSGIAIQEENWKEMPSCTHSDLTGYKSCNELERAKMCLPKSGLYLLWTMGIGARFGRGVRVGTLPWLSILLMEVLGGAREFIGQ